MDIVIVVLIVAVILWAIYSMYGDGRHLNNMGGGAYMPGIITILLVVILVIILLRLI